MELPAAVSVAHLNRQIVHLRTQPGSRPPASYEARPRALVASLGAGAPCSQLGESLETVLSRGELVVDGKFMAKNDDYDVRLLTSVLYW